MKSLVDIFPVAIIQDRHGQGWIAIAEATAAMDGMGSRVEYCLAGGPSADDLTAQSFWLSPPEWVAIGRTPDLALAALRAR